ncbi:MAG: FtsX-like permease family protein [Sulfitobacter sp.]
MSLRLAARFAARELRGGLRGFRLFLACLALGVAAIAAVGSVRSGIEAGLAREGAALLGGDAELELTYRFANEAETAWMQANASKISEIAEFRSMATTPTDRALTQVKAVDENYPLVGTVELTPDMPLSAALAPQGARFGAAMERALIDRLGLIIGDEFTLGTQPYILRAGIKREPDNVAAGFALGPRTLVTRDSLADSGLLTAGTLFNSKYRLTLTQNIDITTLEKHAQSTFEGSGMRWRDARDGAPGVARFVNRLSAFLILVGLSGLAVGGVGVSAAVRSYLARKTQVIATLRALGADRSTIFQTYFIQIGLLSLLGIMIGVALGAFAPLAIAPILEDRLPIPTALGVYPMPLIEAALYGLLTAFIFTLWPLARTDRVRAATLFRDAWDGANRLPSWPFICATLSAVAALIGLAGWFNGSWWLTLWTLGGIAGALLLLAFAAFVIRICARILSHRLRGWPRARWAMAAIGGTGEGASAVILSLGLGLSVLAAVGQIDGNLRKAIAGNLPDVAPSYFFVDIQKDQMEGYSKRLTDDPAVSRIDSAPMLRGVITQINGKPARDVAGDHWVLRGDRGVTYAATAGPKANITHGEWWDADYSGPPLISFATEEALEMGLKLGDSITVNVLGRDIIGTIANFQEVDFSTAGIGFILTMNPSALQAAPHTFISTVYAEPQAETAILRDLASAYPNITAIRVRDAINRVADVLGGVAAATSYGAAATLVTGFLVLIGAAAAGADARTYEAAVLKTLGASRRMIAASFVLRAALLGLAAGAVALLAGTLGGWAVSTYVMETEYAVIWPSALLIIAGGISATVIAGLGFARRALLVRPARVLRARE